MLKSLGVIAALCASALGQLVSSPDAVAWTPAREGRSTVFTLPAMPSAADLEAQANRRPAVGWEFAVPVEFGVDPTTQGEWENVNGGAVWRGVFRSPGATSLSMHFSDFYLPEGAAMWAHSATETKGPWMSNNNRPQRDFGFFPLNGDEITLEVFVPTFSNVVGIALAPAFKVDSVAHGFRPMLGSPERSCHINTECHKDIWHDEIRAVGMLLTAGGSRVCTGTFINNVESDGRQLFLTAAHCSTRDTYGVMFNYEAAKCEDDETGPTDQTIFGMTTLGRYSPSDYHLLEVDLPIPDNYNVFLAGFSAVNTPTQDPTGISHPRGRVKKYAFGKKPVTPDRWSSSEPGDYHWRIANWDSGMTDPGSSGSAMFDEEHRIIGQLHGGTASCGNPSGWDSYGAVWASWDAPSGTDKAKLYLDPKGTNTLTVDGIDLNKARAAK